MGQLLKTSALRLTQAGCESPRLDAELLLGVVLGLERVQLLTRANVELADPDMARFEALLARREKGEPMAYILGTKEFFGHEFEVTPAVLIPRPDTEKLVEVALALGGIKIIDVCTGSGCIAISLALAKPDAQVTATDLSPQALEIAKRNVARYGLQDRVILLEGGLLTPCHNLRDVDLIVANPPYIKPSAMSTLMRDVRDFEPHLALEGGGDDGLSCHLQIIEAARILLKPFGNVILEIGYDQKPDLENRMFDGFSLPRFVEDDAGNVRLVIYQKQE